MVRARVRVAFGGAVLAGAVALSGCLAAPGAPGGAPGATPAPSSTEFGIPSPDPATPLRVTEIQSLDATGYFSLTQEERQAYVDYRVAMNAEHHATSVEGKDRPVWTPMSLDMPGQQILDNFNYLSDEAGFSVLIGGDGTKVLWLDEAVKVQSGAYWDSPGPTSMSNAFLRDVDFIVSREGKGAYLTEQKWTLVTDSAPIAGKDVGGIPVTYRDLVFTDESGATVIGRFNYLTYSAFDGQQKVAWLLDSIRE